jgi:hypothetical protein
LSLLCGEQKKTKSARVKYWETIADNLSKAGWTWGCSSQLIRLAACFSQQTRTAATVAGSLFSHEKLTAFLELEKNHAG